MTKQIEYEDDSYFVSMTDLMVGLLFIFIIMLMLFVLSLKEAEEQTRDTVDILQGARETRDRILQDIGSFLEIRGVNVIIDEENGILRLPENALQFATSSAVLDQEGERNLSFLSDALVTILPCYSTHPPEIIPIDCPEGLVGRIEAIFIEGHTDNTQFSAPTTRFRDNLDLSSGRAAYTYRSLLDYQSNLIALKNGKEEQLLSVSGYGDERPLPESLDQSTDELRRLNRRIDLRFIMQTPPARDVEAIRRRVEASTKQ